MNGLLFAASAPKMEFSGNRGLDIFIFLVIFLNQQLISCNIVPVYWKNGMELRAYLQTAQKSRIDFFGFMSDIHWQHNPFKGGEIWKQIWIRQIALCVLWSDSRLSEPVFIISIGLASWVLSLFFLLPLAIARFAAKEVLVKNLKTFLTNISMTAIAAITKNLNVKAGAKKVPAFIFS